MKSMLQIAIIAAILSTLVGCFKVNVDANVAARPHIHSGGSSSADSDTQYTSYAYELDQVLKQQETVEKELNKRDWEELSEEVFEWQRKIRRLVGVANETDDPIRLRELCRELDDHVDGMKNAVDRRDSRMLRLELRGCEPSLDRLSNEFPLTKPKSDTQEMDQE